MYRIPASVLAGHGQSGVVPDRFADLAVQALDCISRIDQLGDCVGEREERGDPVPVAPPAFRDRQVPLASRPLLEGLQHSQSRFRNQRLVDRLKGHRNRRAFLPRSARPIVLSGCF